MAGPSFRNPPAVERVLTVQFRELPKFEIVHYGLWYQRIQDQFPYVMRQPRLQRIVEQIPFNLTQQRLRIGVETTPELPRCVFAASQANATRLHQLQPDRFALNWRRNTGAEYRRYADTSQDFAALFGAFQRFCQEFQIGDVVPDVCEVVYVNRIDCPAGVPAAEYMGRIFRGVDLSSNVDWLPNPRATAFNCLFDFDEAQGRLYSETSVGQNKEREFVLFKLTGRTLLASSEDWRQRLTDAHDWVVNGFVAMTNEEIRKTEWEQEQ